MYKKGNYVMSVTTFQGKESWLIRDITKTKDFHTHVLFRNRKAAEMIVVRAFKGKIPDSYPDWMITSINRLWYGKDYENRKELDNTNLLIKDEEIRIKRKSHRKIKYKNNIRRKR